MGRKARVWLRGLIAGAALSLAPAPEAAAVTPQQAEHIDRFALGNAAWILYHEIGHLLVSEFRLPVLGREEDAVDHLATVTLLEAATPETDAYLTDAIDGFFLSARVKRQNNSERLYFAGHGLDEQRAYEVACLMIGNDARAFTPLADSIDLPADQRARCPDAYRLARSSWLSVLEPHTSGWLSRPSRDAVTYDYGEAGKRNAEARAVLMNAELLEAASEYLASKYVFPRQVALRAAECGEANAYFAPSPGEVVICYELVEEFRTLLRRYYEGH